MCVSVREDLVVSIISHMVHIPDFLERNIIIVRKASSPAAAAPLPPPHPEKREMVFSVFCEGGKYLPRENDVIML